MKPGKTPKVGNNNGAVVKGRKKGGKWVFAYR
jgi:hypothetical protein